MAAPRSARRRRFDDADWQPAQTPAAVLHRSTIDEPEDEPDDEPAWSTYRDAQRGPAPVPDWVVVDPRAIDADLGVLKSGKEADVSLVERAVTDDVLDTHGPRRAL